MNCFLCQLEVGHHGLGIGPKRVRQRGRGGWLSSFEALAPKSRFRVVRRLWSWVPRYRIGDEIGTFEHVVEETTLN